MFLVAVRGFYSSVCLFTVLLLFLILSEAECSEQSFPKHSLGHNPKSQKIPLLQQSSPQCQCWLGGRRWRAALQRRAWGAPG